MGVSIKQFAATACTALLCLLLGCPGAGDGEAPSAIGAGDTALKLSIIPVSPSRVSASEQLVASISALDDGYSVTLSTSAEFPNVSELFISVDYGDTGLSPQDISVLGAEDGVLLGAAFPSGSQTIDFGLTPIGEASPNLIKPGKDLFSFKLRTLSGDKASSAAGKQRGARARNLQLGNRDGQLSLMWDYTNPGDSNQDGEVGISDLREIGANFRAAVADRRNDPLRHIDADSNGEINLADVSSIGSNLRCVVTGYDVQASPDGLQPFETIKQVERRSQDAAAGAIRFVSEIAQGAGVDGWFRVVPVLQDPGGGSYAGLPSECISISGRKLLGVPVEAGSKKRIIVTAEGLDHPISHMNACRVVYPAGYRYVVGSFNAGSPGGSRESSDGIWSSLTSILLLPPENLISAVELQGGLMALDFNVTAIDPQLSAAPVGYGDLFSFELEKVEGPDLDLSFELGQPSGVKRSYYSEDREGGDFVEHFFGSTIGFRVD